MNTPTQQHRRRGRTTAAVVATTALAAGALSALPASATLTGNGVRADSNITVFHNIDFVAATGYGPAGRPVTVKVIRNGVTIGSATGPAVLAEGASGLEVNHGPEGAAAPGDCWEGHTPDIRPGDVIQVTDTRGTDEVTVDNIAFTGQPAEETPGGDILVPFTALRANGDPIPVGFIDSAEFRAASNGSVRFEAPNVLVEEVPLGAPGEYQMRYPSPFTPSRNDRDDPFDQGQLREALLGDGHAIGFGHVDPLPLESMLYDGLEDTPGPAPGCEGSQGATHAVSDVTPRVINSGTAAGTPVRVSGFSQDAGTVEVQLTDGDGTVVSQEANLSAPAGFQTWSAQLEADRLADLEGSIQVVALVDGAPTAARTLLKDTVAPGSPTASLAAGTYRGVQQVTLNAGASDEIRYTLGNGRQAAPTADTGTVYRGGQIRIASTSTLKMVAVDSAGNASTVAQQTYRIVRAPSAPRIRRASAGQRGGADTAVARWAAPLQTNGSRITGYQVTALRLRPNGSVAARVESRTLRPNVRAHEMRLRSGRYLFQVRAVNAGGTSRLSARSNAVLAR